MGGGARLREYVTRRRLPGSAAPVSHRTGQWRTALRRRATVGRMSAASVVSARVTPRRSRRRAHPGRGCRARRTRPVRHAAARPGRRRRGVRSRPNTTCRRAEHCVRCRAANGRIRARHHAGTPVPTAQWTTVRRRGGSHACASRRRRRQHADPIRMSGEQALTSAAGTVSRASPLVGLPRSPTGAVMPGPRRSWLTGRPCRRTRGSRGARPIRVGLRYTSATASVLNPAESMVWLLGPPLALRIPLTLASDSGRRMAMVGVCLRRRIQ